jgi:pantoate--beta-alanine ligase
MEVCRTVEELRQALAGRSYSLGFVPTMGAFHEGHLSLMRESVRECDQTVVSLFLNPTQFAPTEDLANYPKPFERDLELAEKEGVDLVFAPEKSTMYPRDTVRVRVTGISEEWEGAARPTHFEGVATVVLKLIEIVRPDVAFFGLKDLQQCAVIKELVKELFLPIHLRFLETVRESSGLALSSRNAYFSPADRESASALALELASLSHKIYSDSLRDQGLMHALQSTKDSLQAKGFQVEYLAAINLDTFRSTFRPDHKTRLIVAAKYKGVRLIDNLSVPPPEHPAFKR